MISSVRGTVLHLDADGVVVDVGGVGFSVACTPDVVREFHVGDELVLHTTLIVREDALSLYGFRTRDELGVFTLLLSVSGVGPKSALGALSALSVDQISAAVGAEDDAPFRKVSGIGPKTAKLIVVQLAGKLRAAATTTQAAGGAARADVAGQVLRALVALGWSERVATEAIAELDTDRTLTSADVPVLLKQALAQLGPARPERSDV